MNNIMNISPYVNKHTKSRTYSPKIGPAQVHRLYKLKQLTKIPMTKLVYEALEDYLTNKENIYPQLKGEKKQ